MFDQQQNPNFVKYHHIMNIPAKLSYNRLSCFGKKILKCENITGEESQWVQSDDNSSQDPSDKMSLN